MSEKDLYMPLFYNCLDITESLSDSEFGQLVRMLLKKLGGRGEPDISDMPRELGIAYSFMLESAMRIVGRGCNAKEKNRNKPTEYKRYGSFDPKEAFERALERSYGTRK